MLEPKKVTLNKVEYVIGRLDLFQSLNVSRLVSPILPIIFHETLSKIADAIIASRSETEAEIEDKLKEIANLLLICQPVLKEISQMKREDFETVIQTCLGCVERKVDKSFTKVCSDGVILFDDIDQGSALVLVFHVLARELRPTIAALLG